MARGKRGELKSSTWIQVNIQKNGKAFDLSDLSKTLLKDFPEWRASMLGFVGATGKRRLKQRFLSGQELDLRKYPYDSTNRRTVSYSVGRNSKHVVINSYPVNLYERGRTLRSGAREPGKYIITKKLKQLMLSELPGILSEFDKKFLEPMMQKALDKA